MIDEALRTGGGIFIKKKIATIYNQTAEICFLSSLTVKKTCILMSKGQQVAFWISWYGRSELSGGQEIISQFNLKTHLCWREKKRKEKKRNGVQLQWQPGALWELNFAKC